jgi:EmrB/QacA subfamily drug resistance transporter
MRKWLPLVAISLGTFMLLVDVTIVNVALPKMVLDLHSSFSTVQWVLDIYALALAALLMTAGAVADRFGRRRFYLIGLVVFALASLACGLAPNAGLLIAARAVQGIGGAAMFATTTALLSTTYSGRDRGTAFGVWGAVAGAAAAAGPLVGGALTDWDWRTIFLVNLPVAAIALVMTARVIAEPKSTATHRIDVLGAATFTVSASAITYGLIRAGSDGWTSARTLTMWAIGAVALIAFVFVEQRRPDPMLDLTLFWRPSFAALMAGSLLLQAAAFSHMVYTSLWLQSVRGLSPIEAGAAGSAPLSILAFVVSGAGGRFLHKLPPRLPIGIGMVLVGTGVLLQTLLATGSSWPALLPGMLLSGIGVGLAMPVLASTALGAVPPQRAGMAGGALNTFRQLGLALGIAVLGTLFSGRIRDALGGPVAGALTSGRAAAVIAGTPASRRPAVEHAIRAAFASGLDRIYLIAGIAGIAAGLVVLGFVRPDKPTADPVGVRELATQS